MHCLDLCGTPSCTIYLLITVRAGLPHTWVPTSPSPPSPCPCHWWSEPAASRVLSQSAPSRGGGKTAAVAWLEHHQPQACSKMQWTYSGHPLQLGHLNIHNACMWLFQTQQSLKSGRFLLPQGCLDWRRCTVYTVHVQDLHLNIVNINCHFVWISLHETIHTNT